jgi:hypothetical protein
MNLRFIFFVSPLEFPHHAIDFSAQTHMEEENTYAVRWNGLDHIYEEDFFLSLKQKLSLLIMQENINNEVIVLSRGVNSKPVPITRNRLQGPRLLIFNNWLQIQVP